MSGARCKSCGRAIDWIKTRSGKNMPLDIGRVLGGNVIVNDKGEGVVITPDPNQTAFVTHFTTCPNAEEHRRVS